MNPTMISAAKAGWSTVGDGELVRLCREGNREAFGEIVARYQRLICSLAYCATGDINRSEDLAQETFIAAWRNLLGLREPARLRSWICGIARNVIHGALRADRREPTHRAEDLGTIAESEAVEPLPVDRAIRAEEADILWRCLERIPEVYRLPLVLFYREQRSVEAVAEHLELTEMAVRQRLARGRKLLESEVVDFVEATLTRTAPDVRFRYTVLAALPGPSLLAPAPSAALGAGLAKAGGAAKGTWSLAALGGVLTMLGAAVFSWKTAVDEAATPEDRRLRIRLGLLQVGWLALTLAIVFIGFPSWGGEPWLLGGAVAGILLITLLLAVFAAHCLQHGRWGWGPGTEPHSEVSAGMSDCPQGNTQERGSPVELRSCHSPGAQQAPDRPDNGAPPPTFTSPASIVPTERDATRKAFRWIVPSIILLGYASTGLPWREHGYRSFLFVLTAVVALCFGYRQLRRQALGLTVGRGAGSGSVVGRLWKHPLVRLPVVLFGAAVLGGVFPLMFMPGAPRDISVLRNPTLQALGIGILAALGIYILIAWAWLRKKGLSEEALAEAAIARVYAPLFQEWNVSGAFAGQVCARIKQKARAITERTACLLASRADDSARRVCLEEIRRESARQDASLQAYLGVERHADLQRFERTVPDRQLIRAFVERTAKIGEPVGPERERRLLLSRIEAREAFEWRTELGRVSRCSVDFLERLDEAILQTATEDEARFELGFQDRISGWLSEAQRTVWMEQVARQQEARMQEFRTAAMLFRGSLG